MFRTKTLFALVTAVAIALPAHAQTFAPPPAPKSAKQTLGASGPKAAGPMSRPAGKNGASAGQASHPGSSNLTPEECRKLGGKTTVDDTGVCKLRMRCTIVHGNGDVNSSCIDEAA